MSFDNDKNTGKKDLSLGVISTNTAGTNTTAKPDVFLGKGSKIVGSLKFSGTVEIQGEVEGEIHSDGKLILGEGAQIKALVHGAEVVVRGNVFGDIFASKKLKLEKPAVIKGNLKCALLSIDEGVSIEGKISMDTTNTFTSSKIEKAA